MDCQIEAGAWDKNTFSEYFGYECYLWQHVQHSLKDILQEIA